MPRSGRAAAPAARTPFVFALGLAAGALIAALVVPETQRDTTVAAGTGAGAGGGAAVELGDDAGLGAGGGAAGSDGGAGDAGGEAGASGGETGTSGGGTDAGATPTGPEGGTPTPGQPGADGAGPGSATAPAPGSNARGVTAQKIRIGVGIPDVGAFGAVSENYDIGDVKEQMAAILDGWRRKGLVPVHGRDIEFVYRTYSIIGSDEQVAACQGFVQDDQVFAVLAVRSFEAGADCVAGQFKTPVVTLNSEPAARYAQNAPFFFTVRPELSTLLRNWMRWADERGLLKGKKIGLYSPSDATYAAAVDQGVRRELQQRGYKLAADVTTSNASFGGPEDQVAVQRFRSAGVDLAMLVVSTVPQTNFMQYAEAQLYKPTYIDTDVFDHTSDAAASIYPTGQYDRTLAMTATRGGEIRAGMPTRAETKACVDNYERFSGRKVNRSSPENAEYYNILVGCDDAELMLRALQGAGPDLTTTAFVQAMERLQGVPMAGHADVSFSPQRRYGATQYRTVQWSAGCRCWKALDPFRPFWYP